MDDTAGATGTDTPRPVATAGDNDFTLSIEQVSERYASAGHPRTIRTLQRYCASGHLDAQKIATTLGDKYLVTPLSDARHIVRQAPLEPCAHRLPPRVCRPGIFSFAITGRTHVLGRHAIDGAYVLRCVLLPMTHPRR